MKDVPAFSGNPPAAGEHDKDPSPCRADDKGPTLPRRACLPINRCSLPARILGSLTFQRHPSALQLDGVGEPHHALFEALDTLPDRAARAQRFMDYMTVRFCLEQLEEAGLSPNGHGQRAKANYLRVVRGWSFDSDGREGAVLKGWVESRFGLQPRHHGEPLRDFSGEAYLHYLEQRAAGLYGTNALEAQLDLLYAYCQYELARRDAGLHVTLYRGVNHVEEHEVMAQPSRNRQVLLLNNISSFTASRERASEFGDYILCGEVPRAKVFCYTDLLPGRLRGEDEYLVIGGLYEVSRSTV